MAVEEPGCEMAVEEPGCEMAVEEPGCAMAVAAKSASLGKEERVGDEEDRVGDGEEFVVSSPASAKFAPHTPEVAATRSAVDRDYDEEEVESVSYDEEEPVAISRVRAFALARRSMRRECKVTLESARAKLDGVKATRENHLKTRKLENFLSGDGMDALLSSESQGHFSVKKARAQLEAVKIKELEKAIILSSGKGSRKGSKACGVDEELGVWVRQAKVKLEATRAKTLKANRKRKFGTKKRSVQRRIAGDVSYVDREEKKDHVDLVPAADGVEVAVDSEVAEEPILKGKRRKAPKLKAVKLKAVRVSERIANSRLRMQEELVTLNVKAEIGSKKTKARRNKPEEICTDTSGAEDTGAATSERDTESSALVSLEFTPRAKRRKIQQTVDEIAPPPGARLSSGVECVPPVSPYGLIQEHLYLDPWKVLVACILLNQTGGRQMHKVIWDLFELCPDAEKCVSTETEKIGQVIHSLGLQNKRAKTLQRFSQEYMGTTWSNVTQLHGIGEYGRDAYAIFCEGRWEEVHAKDVVLNRYCRWLSDTQGLGYGFSQIE